MKDLFYFVYGSSDGYKLLRKSPGVDINNVISDAYYEKRSGGVCNLGISAYSFMLRNNYICITKNVIVSDEKNDDRLGFVSLSIAISTGVSIESPIEVLDKCFKSYQDNFISNYNSLNDDKEPSNFDHDIEKYLNEVQKKEVNKYDFNSINSKQPAYIFYNEKNLNKILKHENIFQKEYKEYREIYLIVEGEKDNNILNALKHEPKADLTNKINLDNPDYTVSLKREDDIYFEGVSEGKKVKLNDKANLKFTKQYYKTEKATYRGTWKDLIENYPSVIFKSKELPNTIVVQSPQFEPESKEIHITFKDGSKNNKAISEKELDYHIESEIKGKKIPKRIRDSKIKLEGEELGMIWILSVKKGEYYKAIKNKRIQPSFQHKVDVVLERNDPPFNWRPVMMMLAGIILVVGIGVLGYLGYNYMFVSNNETENSKVTQVSENNTAVIDYIESYLRGDKLLSDTLETFQAKLSDNDTVLLTKTKDYLRFRKAIDGNNRNEIQYVYDSLELLKSHNRMIEIILDSLDFDKYKSINNRKSMLLSELSDTINSMLDTQFTQKRLDSNSEVKELTTKNDNKPVNEADLSPEQDKTQSNTTESETEYSKDDFLQKIKNGDSLEKDKMTNQMKKIIKLKKNLDISGKDFKDIANSKNNLDYIEKYLENLKKQ